MVSTNRDRGSHRIVAPHRDYHASGSTDPLNDLMGIHVGISLDTSGHSNIGGNVFWDHFVQRFAVETLSLLSTRTPLFPCHGLSVVAIMFLGTGHVGGVYLRL